jgi:hypothetical protein
MRCEPANHPKSRYICEIIHFEDGKIPETHVPAPAFGTSKNGRKSGVAPTVPVFCLFFRMAKASYKDPE